MKEHNKIIFNFKGMIFQTEDLYLERDKHKDLRYWNNNRFNFVEGKKGWGSFSTKDLKRIILDIRRDPIMSILKNKEETEFRISFLTEKNNPGRPETIVQTASAPNPVQAVEKALMKANLFAGDVIKTEISDPKNGDITDTSLAEIDQAEKKIIKIKVKRRRGKIMSKKVITIKDLATEFGIEPKRVRVVARRIGLKPNPTGIEGFGPKKKYEWPKDSKEVAQLSKALTEDAEEDEEVEEEEAEEEVEETKK